LNIDVLCTVSSRHRRLALDELISKRVGLVNKPGVSIHHIIKPALLLALAFIFDERAAPMVNRWFVPLSLQTSRDARA
jgi:hypothetical protein